MKSSQRDVRVSRVGKRKGDSFLSPELQRESIARVCQREGLELRRGARRSSIGVAAMPPGRYGTTRSLASRGERLQRSSCGTSIASAEASSTDST